MNFDRTLYSNSFTKSPKNIFFKNNLKDDETFHKINPSFSINNSPSKNRKNPLLLRTSQLYFQDNSLIHNKTNKSNKSNYTQIKYDFRKLNPKTKVRIKKIKIKKSFSELFQNNEVDLVRNLNIDSLSQFNNNVKLKENLINLSKDYFEKPEKKLNKIFFNYNSDNNVEDLEEQKNKRELLPILNRNIINKSFEFIQAKNQELKLELSELAQKEVINKIKILRKEIDANNNKKKEFFMKVKEINEEMKEIEDENDFVKDIYLKEINNLAKDKNDGIDLFDEIMKYIIKSKFYGKNKQLRRRKSFLYIIDKKKAQDKLMEEDMEQSPIEKKESIKNKNSQDFQRLESFEKNIKKSNKKKKYDSFMKDQNERMEKLKEDKKDIEEKINLIELEMEKNKKEEKILVNKLMMSYKESLFKGTNVKNEGLVWIIKAIWNLGENVPMSFMPNFLDSESIDYLFKLALKHNSLEALIKKKLEVKIKLKKKIFTKSHFLKSQEDNDDNEDNVEKTNEIINNNKSLSVKAKLVLRLEKETKLLERGKKKDVYRALVKKFKGSENKFEIINMPEIFMIKKLENKIKKAREELLELKRNEINRIIKCFLENNYENKYHTNIETVLAALIGEDEKDTEMNRYNIAKKNYFASIRQIRFYSHRYMSKFK